MFGDAAEQHPPIELLRADGLWRSFGGVAAVADVSFSLRQNEILGLIGPNGAGKSTTFDLISGFRPADRGRLFLLGEDVTGQSPARISRKGLVRTFQHGSVFPDLTVYDNILIATLVGFSGGHARDHRVRECAHLFGLDSFLQDKAGRLPHGTQRLLSIAIAVAPRPRVLCLDECLTGLSSAEVERVVDILQHLAASHGAAILFVDHNMRGVMRVCHRIVVLQQGRVLAEGTPEEIARNPVVIEAYLGHSA
jgi:branched-chain amino acid transport system ATP-binding protein